MSSESERSGYSENSPSEEQHREASSISAAASPAESRATDQQIPPAPTGDQPSPYTSYSATAYPSYPSYSPHMPYLPYSPYPYAPNPVYPYFPVPVTPTTSGLAIASFVCGVLAPFAFPYLGIAAAICGHLALGEIRSSGGFVEGKGFAIAGLVLGYVMLGLGIIGFLLYVLLIFAMLPRVTPAGFVFPLPW